MDKQDIINYVLKTPTNTNPAVLSGMLDSIESGGGAEEGVLLYEGMLKCLPAQQFYP